MVDKFLKAVTRGCRKHLNQYDTTMNARARGPGIRAGELKEEDTESVKVACAALVPIPRQHTEKKME